MIANTDVPDRPLRVEACTGPAEVAALVREARARGLALAVRGGGYSPAGFGTVQDGLVADLGRLSDVVVDRDARTVTIGGGTLAGAVEVALSAHGLAANLPVPSRIGVVGAALSGGVGVLLRRLGWVGDAIVAAELVTGTGELLCVDDASDPELMWALRGGGGNFGAVTSLTLECAELGEITVHQVLASRAALPEALRFVRDWSAGRSDDLTAVPFVRRLPPLPGLPAERVDEVGLLLTTVHAGPAELAHEELAGLADLPGAVLLREQRTSLLRQREAAEAGFPDARFGASIRSGWARSLPDAALDAVVGLADRLPSPQSAIELVRLGGAAARERRPSSAPGRASDFLLNAMALWTDPGLTASARAWSRDAAALIATVADGPAVVPGFASTDEADRGPASYGADYARLQAVKDRLDPDNVFRSNLNILPTC